MTPQRYVWVSVAEAAERLGVSASTVRRMVEDGKLVGEREPMGGSRERYRIRLDAPETHHDASPSESGMTPHDAPETPQDASAALSASLAALTDALDSERAERQKLADDLGAARERAARAEATAAAERERRLAAEQERDRLRNRRWWKPSTW